jgi:signal peptidase II
VSPSAAGPPRWVRALGIAAIVVALDQLSKDWALRALSDDRTIDIIGSLRFNLAFNTGASFSMGSGLGPLLAVVVVVVVVLLLRFVRHVPGRLNLVAVGLVVGGAIGNLVDRMFRDGLDGSDGILSGAVVDFIDVQWWPIFNVADVGVVVGAVLLLIGTWRLGDAPDLEPDDAPTPASTEEG